MDLVPNLSKYTFSLIFVSVDPPKIRLYEQDFSQKSVLLKKFGEKLVSFQSLRVIEQIELFQSNFLWELNLPI